MSRHEPMEVKAIKLPALRRYLEREGLYEKVLAAVGPEARAMLERPPLPTSWVPTARFYEVYGAVYALRGPGSARAMSYDTTLSAYGPMVRNLVSTLLSLVGASPATLLSRADSLVGLFERGTEYDFASTGERSGVVTVHASSPLQIHAWEAFEALPLVAFELSGNTGTSRLVEVRPDERSATYEVEW